MNPTATRPVPAPARSSPPWRTMAVAAAVAVAALAAATLFLPRLDGDPFVDSLTVENPHPWDATVRVSGPDRDTWIVVGTVDRGSTRTLSQLRDVGDTWVFGFRYGGIDAAEVELTRDELEAAGWTVTVPDGFAERLEQAGVGPSV